MIRATYKRRRRLIRFLLYFLVILMVLFSTSPLIWALLSSVKGREEVLSAPPTLLPKSYSLESYRGLVSGTGFFTYYKNSTIVAVLTTLIALGISTLGAYGLTRFRFLGKGIFSYIILFSYMLPMILLCIPLLFIIVRFGLVDTLSGLVVAYLTFNVPFSLWILRDFFQTIPIELEEASFVDGASRFQAFIHIILPLALPGIIAAGIFMFALSWNEYLYALIFISSDAKKTLPVGTMHIAEAVYTDWGMMMAAAVLITVPILIFYMFIQRHLTRGFGAGAIKG